MVVQLQVAIYTADTNNPISVKATKDDTNHNTSYAVTFDGNKAAKQIPFDL